MFYDMNWPASFELPGRRGKTNRKRIQNKRWQIGKPVKVPSTSENSAKELSHTSDEK
jgi:hypothetical protein